MGPKWDLCGKLELAQTDKVVDDTVKSFRQVLCVNNIHLQTTECRPKNLEKRQG